MQDYVSKWFIVQVLEIVEDYLNHNPNYEPGELTNNAALIQEIQSKLIDTHDAVVQ